MSVLTLQQPVEVLQSRPWLALYGVMLRPRRSAAHVEDVSVHVPREIVAVDGGCNELAEGLHVPTAVSTFLATESLLGVVHMHSMHDCLGAPDALRVLSALYTVGPSASA